MINAWLIWIAGVTAAAAVLAIVAAYVFARLWARPTRQPIEGADESDLPLQPIRFDSDGDQLKGWYIPAAGEGSHALGIVAHGWSHNRARMLPIADALHQAGLAVLLFDARGHGESGGRPPITLRNFVEDQLAAIGFGQQLPGVDPGRLALVGHSFGAAAAILTASIDPRVRAVVAISPFADPRAVTRRALVHFHLPVQPLLWLSSLIFRRWLGLPMGAFTPLARVQQLQAPLLLIHGVSDRMIPVQASHQLATRANGHGEALFVEGAGHGSVLRSRGVQSRITSFLQDQLSGAGASTLVYEPTPNDPLRRSLFTPSQIHGFAKGEQVTTVP